MLKRDQILSLSSGGGALVKTFPHSIFSICIPALLLPCVCAQCVGTNCITADVSCHPFPVSRGTLLGSSTEIPFLAFTNGQAASLVIGQPDFTSSVSDNNGSGGSAIGPGSIGTPYANPYFDGARLYLPDTWNHRVLGFNALPASNYPLADFVLGQADFSSANSGASATNYNGAQSISGNGTQMTVTDFLNSRILIYNAHPTVTNTAADVVVGAANLNTMGGGCTANQLTDPESSFVAGTKLLIADRDNERVLIFNNIPSANNASADLVLGQADFTSCNGNRGGSPAADTLQTPTDVWSDGTRLIVLDNGNNRVLIWNTFPTSNGQPADRVLGQVDFVSNVSNSPSETVSAAGFNYPYLMACTGRQLFVADESNRRVLIWDTLDVTNGQSADRVLGQPDFTSTNSGPASAVEFTPEGLMVAGKQLFVSDVPRYRYLIFTAP